MELSQLKVFFEVSEHLNFSKAAKKLHLSQPAVSIRIKSLEKSLKVELENLKKEIHLLNDDLDGRFNLFNPEKKMNVAILGTVESEPIYQLLIN